MTRYTDIFVVKLKIIDNNILNKLNVVYNENLYAFGYYGTLNEKMVCIFSFENCEYVCLCIEESKRIFEYVFDEPLNNESEQTIIDRFNKKTGLYI